MKSNDQAQLEEAYNDVDAFEHAKNVLIEASTHNRKQVYEEKGIYKNPSVQILLNIYEQCLIDLEQYPYMSTDWSAQLSKSKTLLGVVQCIKTMTNEQKDAILVEFTDDSWLYEGLEDALFPTRKLYLDYIKYLEQHFTKIGQMKQRLPELQGIF